MFKPHSPHEIRKLVHSWIIDRNMLFQIPNQFGCHSDSFNMFCIVRFEQTHIQNTNNRLDWDLLIDVENQLKKC